MTMMSMTSVGASRIISQKKTTWLSLGCLLVYSLTVMLTRKLSLSILSH